MKVKTKLTILLLSFSVCVMLSAGIFTTISLKSYFHGRIVTEMGTLADQFEYLLSNHAGNKDDTYKYFQQFASAAKVRLTLINTEGKVIFESEVPEIQLQKIENHYYRKEIQDALNKGTGTDIRLSTVVNFDMLYFAKAITEPLSPTANFSDTKFIRVCVPMTYVQEATADIRNKVIYASIFVLIIISVLVFYISRMISRPLQNMAKIAAEVHGGDIGKRIPVRSSDEIGKLSETLNEMLDKLNDDINKLKILETIRSEFLGNVSHELRTPIFAVQGMLETLLGGALEDPEARKDFVQRALANTQRLNTLLNDLIEISRIESGDMKMSFRYFNFREFLKQVISEIQPLAEAKNIILETTIQDGISEVYGDRDRLKQALINLIDNSIKYNKPAGRVIISALPAGGSVKITVEDTGVGIPTEHLSRIFERFYRVDRERSREAGGTGLGLAIVKHIIEAHGSKIQVDSKPGEWSKFSFSLKI